MKMNHIMSVENHLSEPAEPVSVGKGQRSQPKSNSPADATSDGVFVDGMAGNDTEISREICFGGASRRGHTICRIRGQQGTGKLFANCSPKEQFIEGKHRRVE